MNDHVTVTATRQERYRFEVEFGPGYAPIIADESPPIGDAAGPSPQHFLAAAVANCLSASLVFACQKYKEDPGPLSATVTCTTGRNEKNRLRVTQIEVQLKLGAAPVDLPHLPRILETFEDFCTVTRSVEHGIPVAVSLTTPDGTALR